MTDTATMAPHSPELEPMTLDEFKRWYAHFGLNQTELATRLDTTQPTVSKWLSGKHEIPGHLRLAFERLDQILAEERQPKRSRSRRRPAASARVEEA